MNRKLALLAGFAALAAPAMIAPRALPNFISPAWASCDPGTKLDKTTVADIRKILTKAGYTDIHGLRKGCDNTWHGTAAKPGAASAGVAILSDGRVVHDGD